MIPIPYVVYGVSICINSIADRYFRATDGVITVNCDTNLNFPAIRLTETNQSGKAEAYIICIRCEKLDHYLRQIDYTRHYNVGAKHVFILDELCDDFFGKVVKYYILSVVVVVPSETTYNLYGYFPYEDARLNHPNTTAVEMGACPLGFHKSGELFGSVVPKRWGNSSIIWTLSSKQRICTSRANQGAEVGIFRVVFQRLNVIWKRRVGQGEEFFDPPVNNSYASLFGRLQMREAEFLFGGIIPDVGADQFFDITVCYLSDESNWIAPYNDKYNNLLFSALEPMVYVVVLASMVVVWILWHLIDAYHWKETSLERLIWKLFVLIRISWDNHERLRNLTRPSMILLMTYIFCMMTLHALYRNNTFYLFTGEPKTKQIDNLEDIMTSGLRIAGAGKVRKLFPENPQFSHYLKRKFIKVAINGNWLNRTAFQRDVIVVYPRCKAKIQEALFYIDSNGKSKVHFVKNKLYPRPVSGFFVRGHPLYRNVDVLLQKLMEAGIVAKLINQDNHKLAGIVERKVDSLRCRKVNLHDISLLMIQYLVASAISFFAFLLELIWYKYKRNFRMIIRKKRLPFVN